MATGFVGLAFFAASDPTIAQILGTATIVMVLNRLDTGALNAVGEDAGISDALVAGSSADQ